MQRRSFFGGLVAFFLTPISSLFGKTPEQDSPPTEKILDACITLLAAQRILVEVLVDPDGEDRETFKENVQKLSTLMSKAYATLNSTLTKEQWEEYYQREEYYQTKPTSKKLP